MSLEKEAVRSWSRTRDATIGAIRAFKGRSILRTPQAQVKVKHLGSSASRFLVSGRLPASLNGNAEDILRHIVHALLPAHTEKFNDWISQVGKEGAVDQSVSYSPETLPTLSPESRAHLEEIKARAAVRREARLTEAARDVSPAHVERPEARPLANVHIRRGKTLSVR